MLPELDKSKKPFDIDEGKVSLSDVDGIVHHAELPHCNLSRKIDRALNTIGEYASYLWALLVGVIILNVVLRYAFGKGFIVFEEIQWHIYAVGFLIALSYCVVSDDHVRVDLLHDSFKLKSKAWIELIGLALFLIPMACFVVYYSIPFVVNSYSMGEVSDAPGGLPFRWLIKSFMTIGFLLLFLSALSRLLRCTTCLFNLPRKAS